MVPAANAAARMLTVTREQKLALIVGFSLVLLVGVLISDHLSRARQAKIASVSPGESPAPAQVATSATDPLQGLNKALSEPAPAGSGSPNPLTQQVPGPTVSEPAQPTITIAQGPSRIDSGSHSDTALEEAVKKAGGRIEARSDGRSGIILPDLPGAAGTVSAPLGGTPAAISTNPKTWPMPREQTTGKILPNNERFKTHAVQRGETLFQIAGKYYGTGHVWRELAQFNGLANKDGVVREGARLKIPSKELLLGKASPTETAGRGAPMPEAATVKTIRRQDVPILKPEIKFATYTVRKGETLGEISRKVLGSSKRWSELAEFNKLEDEDTIVAGTVLKVPPMRG